MIPMDDLVGLSYDGSHANVLILGSFTFESETSS